jgi:hypothetical protein
MNNWWILACMLLVVSCASIPETEPEVYGVGVTIHNPDANTPSRFTVAPSAYNDNIISIELPGTAAELSTHAYSFSPISDMAGSQIIPIGAPAKQHFYTYAPPAPYFANDFRFQRGVYYNYDGDDACPDYNSLSYRMMETHQPVQYRAAARNITFGGQYQFAALQRSGGAVIVRGALVRTAETEVFKGVYYLAEPCDRNDISSFKQADIASIAVWKNGVLLENRSLLNGGVWDPSWMYEPDADWHDLQLYLPLNLSRYQTVLVDAHVSPTATQLPVLENLTLPTTTEPFTVRFSAVDTDIAEVRVLARTSSQWVSVYNTTVQQSLYTVTLPPGAGDLRIALTDASGGMQNYTIISALKSFVAPAFTLANPVQLSPGAPTVIAGTLTAQEKTLRNMNVYLFSEGKQVVANTTNENGFVTLSYTPSTSLTKASRVELRYGDAGIYSAQTLSLQDIATYNEDLAIERIELPVAVKAGMNTVNITVRNVGTKTLKRELLLQTNEATLFVQNVTLAVGERKKVSAQVLIPYTTSTLFTAELQADDNIANNKYEIAAPIFADVNINFQPAFTRDTAILNHDWILTLDIRNSGLKTASDVRYNITAKDVTDTEIQLASGAIEPIRRNTIQKKEFTLKFPQPGTYLLNMQITSPSDATQDDNELTMYVQVYPEGPHVYVWAYEKDQLQAATPGTMLITIGNDGSETATDLNTIVRIGPENENPAELSLDTIPSLAVDEKRTISIPYTPESKGYVVTAVTLTSSMQNVTASALQYSYAAGIDPDVAVNYVQFYSAPIVNVPTFVEAAINNAGLLPVRDVTVYLFVEPKDQAPSTDFSTAIASSHWDEITWGEYAVLNFTPTSAGDYTVRAVAVTPGETDPSDNEFSVPLTITTGHKVALSVEDSAHHAFVDQQVVFYTLHGHTPFSFIGARGEAYVPDDAGSVGFNLWYPKTALYMSYADATLGAEERLVADYLPVHIEDKQYFFTFATKPSFAHSDVRLGLYVDASLAQQLGMTAPIEEYGIYACTAFNHERKQCDSGWRAVASEYVTQYRYPALVYGIEATDSASAFAIAKLPAYDGATTDLTTAPPMTDLTVERSTMGQIHFTQPVDITPLQNNPALLPRLIEIQPGKIRIDERLISLTNEPADLEFRDIQFANPVLRRNNATCPPSICSGVTYDVVNHVYKVHVTTFSEYTVTASPICGDNVCAATESCSLCSQDCGVCARTSSGGRSHSVSNVPYYLRKPGPTTIKPIGAPQIAPGADVTVESTPRRCIPEWHCGFTACDGGIKRTTCEDIHNCGTDEGKPKSEQYACSEQRLSTAPAVAAGGGGEVDPLLTPAREEPAPVSASVPNIVWLILPVIVLALIVGATVLIHRRMQELSSNPLVYVQFLRNQGLTVSEIEEKLRVTGWGTEDIDAVVSIVEAHETVIKDRKKGKGDAEIREELRNADWSDDEISELLEKTK